MWKNHKDLLDDSKNTMLLKPKYSWEVILFFRDLRPAEKHFSRFIDWHVFFTGFQIYDPYFRIRPGDAYTAWFSQSAAPIWIEMHPSGFFEIIKKVL